jgi:hypothetical protein
MAGLQPWDFWQAVAGLAVYLRNTGMARGMMRVNASRL